MSILWADSFNIYGNNKLLLTEGFYAQIGSDFGVGYAGSNLTVPSFEENGEYWFAMTDRGAGWRRVLGATLTDIGFVTKLRLDTLPSANDRNRIMEFRDGTNTMSLRFNITTDGNIQVANFAGTIVAQTTTPCIVAGTAHKIQAQAVMHSTLGEVEVRVDGVTVIDDDNLVMTGDITQLFQGLSTSSLGGGASMYSKFTVPYSLTGTYNDDWPNISGVATLQLDGDTVDAGWTPRPRQKIEAGILYVAGSGAVLDCDANTDYDLGAGSYTLEAFVRFVEPVTTTNFATILGKWTAATGDRSYRLVKYGPNVNDGALRFEISTDGTLDTFVAVHDVLWEPQIGVWHNVCVCRDGTDSRLFIDGVQQGLVVTDANTYFAATANFTVGGEMSNLTTGVLANSSVDAMFDEIRITPGVARYTSNYTPTSTPYPRSAPADPSFASVVLLCGFDDAIQDESSQAQALNALGSTSRLVPNDAAAAYLSLNPLAPLDDRYLEAALVAASGILTLEDQPANAETVTLGASTYTFNTVLGGAGSVLIGADAEATLSNLAAAINQGAGEGTVYGTGTTQNASASAELGPTANQLTATAITPGAAGNSIASTETLTDGSWTGATLSGGADIPSPSRFTIQSLPPTVTGVRWLGIVSRSWVTDGAATMQPAFFVGTDDALGADHAMTTTPTYRLDGFEEDPSTSAALTPTSILNASIQLDRTT